jgi:hypothetical protein
MTQRRPPGPFDEVPPARRRSLRPGLRSIASRQNANAVDDLPRRCEPAAARRPTILLHCAAAPLQDSLTLPLANASRTERHWGTVIYARAAHRRR